MPAGGPKRLNWKWEELVLACDLVMQNNGRSVDDTDPRAIELSELLRKMDLHPQEDRLPQFRNPNGVAQKTRNLMQHFPGYTGSASRGSSLDREVVERFIAEPEVMHATADSIRALAARQFLSEPGGNSPAEIAFATLTGHQQRSLSQEYQRLCGRADVYWQGRDENRATRTSSVPIRYENARRAVMLRSQGHCENPCCTGDLRDRTDAGEPILEVDHIHDLAKGGEDNPMQMIALCPNCHAMKTRGSTRRYLKQVLVAEALRRHDELSDT